MKSILFLGYGRFETSLISHLEGCGYRVWNTDMKIGDVEFINEFSYVISFGYRHIIPADIVTSAVPLLLNLHISYLPYNKGAHPAFWCFYEETPAGVSLHQIEAGVDTGGIFCQSTVDISPEKETFRSAHLKLRKAAEDLFISSFDSICDGTIVAKPQEHLGTLHKVRDLPEGFSGWDSNIMEEISRLKKEKRASRDN